MNKVDFTPHTQPWIEIMDTTLRDGEQTSGVSFSSQEKLSMAKLLLDELHIDRIEVASARVSEGEFKSVQRLTKWAKDYNHLSKIEILGFVDKGMSIDWIIEVGGNVLNLLSKGSLKHCQLQLNKTPKEHFSDIRREVTDAHAKGLKVNLYLEDWSNGMIHSPEYVYQMVQSLQDLPIERYMLPDTLGILNPNQTYYLCRKMIQRFPHLRFDFHAHNDYDLATANTFAAALSGIHGVHTTINGLGERAGNAPLSSVLAVLHDQLKVKTNLVESSVNQVSRVVESYSGIRIPQNKPIVGDFVFTQCAGVHADGDNKHQLYYNDLLPERFGRKREYALGKTSGKANISKNLEELGIELDQDAMRKVTDRIIELGDTKEMVTSEDLPYIIADVLNQEGQNETVNILNYSMSLAKGLKPNATVKIEINGKQYEESAMGDGQYDAFVKAIRKIYKEQLNRSFPKLTNYWVDIPPGGRTDAFVQTIISWEYQGDSFRTRGLDADQTNAAIKATLKMLNKIENKYLCNQK